MKFLAIYSILIGFFTTSFAFVFIGALILLYKYFRTVLVNESIRYDKQKEFNEGLKRMGRLN